NLGQIYRFDLNPGRTALAVSDAVANSPNELNQHLFASGFTDGITGLVEAPDGALYVVNIGSNSIYKIDGGGGPGVHDLAIASLKAPRKATLSASKPTVTGRVAVPVVNRGSETETIPDLDALGALVSLNVTALTGACPTAPVPALVPPKRGVPLVLAPGK